LEPTQDGVDDRVFQATNFRPRQAATPSLLQADKEERLMNHIDVDKYDPADEPTGDRLHRLVRTAIGFIPVGSGAALEVWNQLVEDPYQKRRTKWLQDLSEALNNVSDVVEEIKNDGRRQDAILSSILQSTDIAIRTGDAGIHERLVSIVLNTIKDQSPNEELLSLYLSTIRQLTSSHLELLRWISSRERYGSGSDLENQERAFFVEIDKLSGISTDIPKNRLLKDLESLSLIYSPEHSPWRSGGTNYCTMTVTHFGGGFTGYISSVN
jgi:hypothetical protein